MEGQDAGKQAGDQQHVHHLARPWTEHGIGGSEVEAVEAGSSRGLHLALTIELHDCPGGEGIEESDEQHGNIGGAGNGLFRIFGFLAENGRSFEADEGTNR